MSNNENNKKSESTEFFKKPVTIVALIAVVVAVIAVVVFVIVPNLKPNNTPSDTEDVVTGANTAAESSGDNTTADASGGVRIIAAADGSVVAGDTVTVRIKLENVTDLASVALTATWDEELTLIDASYGTEFSGGLRHTPDMDNEGSGWDSVKSPFTFNWVALNTSDAIDSDCVFITAQFKTAADKPGTYHMTLKANPDNIFDSDDENVPFTLTNAEIVVTAAK